MFRYNLSQLVDSPTHRKGNILDLVLTNTPSSISNLTVHPNKSLPISSDHLIITFSVRTNFAESRPRHQPSHYIHDYTKTDWDNLLSHLLDFDFSEIYSTNNIESIWLTLKNTIINATDLYTPKVLIRPSQRPKWFTSSIQHHLNKLHSLRKQVKSSPTPSTISKLLLAESSLQKEMEQAKTKFEHDLVNNFAFNKDYKIFKYIKNIISHNSIPVSVHFGNSSASSDLHKASLFNEFFHTTFTPSSRPPNLPTLSDPPQSSTLSDIIFSPTEVYEALTTLDPSKAKGIDGISPVTLSRCALALYEPIHHLFSLCINQSNIPNEWRIHLISPIFKSGEKTSVTNYRPISLLCILSKVLERLIYDKIIDFVTSSICNVQFGFLKSRSSVQQLLLFYDHLLSSHSQKTQIDTLYLDFKKAFDKVPHDYLLIKLQHIGITGNLWLFFKNYLQNRLHCVTINKCTSPTLSVISGVPQGSILGPLLFLIYINDLPSSLSSSKPLLFADDTKCLKTIRDLSDSQLLQSDIDSLSEWSNTWLLPFNPSKCVILRFFSSSPDLTPAYYLDNTPISISNLQKDLGVTISSDLSWSQHYSNISSKAYKILGLLRRSFNSTNSVQTKKMLYLSLIKSRITYASQLWRPHKKKDIEILERVQRRATKFILQDYNSDYKSRLISLKLLPFMMSLEISDIIFYISSLKNPQDHFDISSRIKSFSSSTRASSNKKLIHNASPSHLSHHHFFFNRLPRLWNCLPPLDLNSSIATLKNQLKSIFWSHFISNFNPDNSCTFHLLCPCSTCSLSPPRLTQPQSHTLQP